MGTEIVKKIDIDLYEPKYTIINAKQHDNFSRKIIFSCYDSGKFISLSSRNCYAFIKYMKPDDRKVLNECEITNDGKVSVVLTEQMLVVPGRCFGEIVIVDKSEIDGNIDITNDNYESAIMDYSTPIISSMQFIVNVIPTTIDNNIIESTDEFMAFNDLMSKILRDYTWILNETNYIETPVRTINGKKPDEYGNFNFVADDWQSIINLALNNAKESGEFDGYTPIKGVDYRDGVDGYTPIKDVDYRDGIDGHTPIKGIDYFTEDDFLQIGMVKSIKNVKPDEYGNVNINPSDINALSNDVGSVTENNIANSSINTGHLINESVTFDKIANNAVSKTYSIIIRKNNWVIGENENTCVIIIDDILKTDDPIVDVDMTTLNDVNEKNLVLDAWTSVYQIKTNDGSIFVYATEIPDIDIPIRIKCVRR